MSVRTAQLGDFVRISGGGTPSRSRPEFFNGSIPWVTVKDLGGEFFLRGAQEHISQAGLDGSASRLIPPGNVLLVARMAVGRAAINTVEVAINQDLKALICDPRLHPKYLLFFLTHKAPELEAKATGATVKGITIDEIESLNIPVLCLSEQKRIAGLLEQADRLRRTCRCALELRDAFLPAAFLELFGDPASNPHGFPRVQVEELFAKVRDGTKCGPFGSALKKHEYQSHGIPVWTMNNFSGGDFREEGCLYVSEEKYRELAAYSVKDGDILISRAGTVGRMAIVKTRYAHSIIHTNLIRLSLDATRLSPIFFITLMKSFGSCIARLKRGQEDAYSFMSTGSLGELRIPLPPMVLQQRFCDLFARHEQLRTRQSEALRQADHLFQSLLHRTFS